MGECSGGLVVRGLRDEVFYSLLSGWRDCWGFDSRGLGFGKGSFAGRLYHCCDNFLRESTESKLIMSADVGLALGSSAVAFRAQFFAVENLVRIRDGSLLPNFRVWKFLNGFSFARRAGKTRRSGAMKHNTAVR